MFERFQSLLLALLLGAVLSACAPPVVGFVLPDAYEEGAGTLAPGLAVVPNIDDDNQNGTVDWDEGVQGEDSSSFTSEAVEGEDDFATVRIPVETFGQLRDNRRLRLLLSGDVGDVRVWSDGRVLLGKVIGGRIETKTLAARDDEQLLQIEFESFLDQALLTLQLENLQGEVLASAPLYMTAAPLIMNHHLQPSEAVWIVDLDEGGVLNNQAMAEGYEAILDDQFTAVPGPSYGGDPWIQDEFEFAWLQAAEQRVDVVIDSIRDRGIDSYAEDELEGPNVVVRTWGDPNPQTVNSLDYFGNLEASPPVTVDGVNYPFGRVYYGGATGYAPDPELTDFFADQALQKPFIVDTTWLCVGHIDEYTSFLPDATAPKGYRFVFSDTRLAWEILEAADQSLPLPRYASAYGLNTVGDLVNSNAVRALNDEIQEDILDPQLVQFKEELNLDDEDILMMPSLFEEPQGCGAWVAALIPGMANLIVANDDSGGNHVFLADPFTRNSSNAEGQDDDFMIQWVKDNYPAELEYQFLDDWYVYHLGLGEVHCGSNVQRTPSTRWWEVAAHLLPEGICTDGVDNDGDGASDCEDSDCSGRSVCEGSRR